MRKRSPLKITGRFFVKIAIRQVKLEILLLILSNLIKTGIRYERDKFKDKLANGKDKIIKDKITEKQVK
ncbi:MULTISPECIES: hypothetical protein [Oscillatoriales]|uniref:hypothetical protein n=1 Tax=Oscillatoriophycideae TaxID=1301283 RepID=UPI00168ADFA8|nr:MULTISPECIES: hypothetical protein [Oscillatoriales]